VLVAFIDESYPNLKDKYFVSAVVVDMVALFDLNQGFRDVISYASSAFGVDAAAELHGHEIMQQRKHWRPLSGKVRAAVKVYKKGLSAIADSGAKVFLEGVDVERLNQRYKRPDDPHEVVLRHVLERVNDYAVSCDRKVLVVADIVPGQANHAAILELFSKIGTPGYRSSLLPQVIHPVRYDDSSLHFGLQAADLVVYLYRRMKCVKETSPAAEKSVGEMWNTILPSLYHSRLWVP
jgi:hypothetical protein